MGGKSPHLGGFDPVSMIHDDSHRAESAPARQSHTMFVISLSTKKVLKVTSNLTANKYDLSTHIYSEKTGT